MSYIKIIEHCRNVKTRDIGETERLHLAIGVSMINQPKFLYIDQFPLDNDNSVKLCNILKNYCQSRQAAIMCCARMTSSSRSSSVDSGGKNKGRGSSPAVSDESLVNNSNNSNNSKDSDFRSKLKDLDMFDKLYVLSNGQSVYFGDCSAVLNKVLTQSDADDEEVIGNGEEFFALLIKNGDLLKLSTKANDVEDIDRDSGDGESDKKKKQSNPFNVLHFR